LEAQASAAPVLEEPESAVAVWEEPELEARASAMPVWEEPELEEPESAEQESAEQGSAWAWAECRCPRTSHRPRG
jgi:hypothetical protein